MRGKRTTEDEGVKRLVDEWQARNPSSSSVVVGRYTFDLPSTLNSQRFREIMERALSSASSFRSAGESTANAIMDLRMFIDPEKEYGHQIYQIPCYRQAIEAIERESGISYTAINIWLRKVRSQLPIENKWYLPPVNKPATRAISVSRTNLGTVVDLSRNIRKRLKVKLELEEGIQYAGPDVFDQEIHSLIEELLEAREYVHRRKLEGAVRTERMGEVLEEEG